MHDERIDEARCRMFVGAGETADDRESKPFPEGDRALIRADHEIELHGLEASTCRKLQRMNTHRAGDAASGRPPIRNITAICDMGAAAHLVWMQVIGPNDLARFLGYEDGVIGPVPVGQRLSARPIARERVGFSGPQNWFKDAPDRISVCLSAWSDNHRVLSKRRIDPPQ